uniref:Uncharacterized protein C17orf89 homolog isoform X2 n=1 Tax=Nicotiana sylvestris TaxID=4096 RepID=A0A1U7XJR7_NICSY|nr:PREDICTED: uncharacterized protein C17orf89 homolog isoform X2 [Nicotiana sylvestris]
MTNLGQIVVYLASGLHEAKTVRHVMMKEKNPTAAAATTSIFKKVLLNCSAQAKVYGSCVAAKVPEVERDMCLKEFLELRSCMQSLRRKC